MQKSNIKAENWSVQYHYYY